ncbi:MAG: hypothetical protein JO112_03830, partial [Planctomycetes bacterium]|nr:hypothetical protein [Planctomycetota bacterium]
PDLDPPHEALQLEESFHEAGRLPQVGRKPEEFRRWLAEAEEETQILEGLLRTGKDQHALDGPAADKVFRQVGAACVRCHGHYRDVPQK